MNQLQEGGGWFLGRLSLWECLHIHVFHAKYACSKEILGHEVFTTAFMMSFHVWQAEGQVPHLQSWQSVQFSKILLRAYKGDNKVLMHGVTRKSGRGLPSCVLQEEVKNAKQEETVRGTTKAAVLEGDPGCSELIAFSIYDTKLVHFLLTACTSLNWVEKTRKEFDKAMNANESMSFLQAVVNDEYNSTMKQVDISDQLWNYYHHWMRKHKWWWAICMWGLQVLLVNTYILYRTTHLLTWKKAEKLCYPTMNFCVSWFLSGLDFPVKSTMIPCWLKSKRAKSKSKTPHPSLPHPWLLLHPQNEQKE